MSPASKIIFTLILLITLGSCIHSDKDTSIDNPKEDAPSPAYHDLSGNYVSNNYDQRDEGFDWVAVSIDHMSIDHIKVSIRSRADRKDPSCTFDAMAQRNNETTFMTTIRDSKILFEFNKDVLTISTKEFDNRFILMSFCNGGGSLQKEYRKIEGELDQSQIDSRPFSNMAEGDTIKTK